MRKLLSVVVLSLLIAGTPLQSQDIPHEDLRSLLSVLRAELELRDMASLDVESFQRAVQEGFDEAQDVDRAVTHVFDGLRAGPRWKFLACDFGACWMRFPGFHVEADRLTQLGNDRVEVRLTLTGSARGERSGLAPLEEELRIILRRSRSGWEVESIGPGIVQ